MEQNNQNSAIHQQNNAHKFHGIYRFFCWCSGARLYLLKTCPTEYNKFFGIGIVLFMTGIMAIISGSYAFYTVFKHEIPAIAFGLLWGLLIFFLDWYLVASLKKKNRMRQELTMAAPRLILSIFIAVVISKPIELKLFEKEINSEISRMNNEKTLQNKDLVDKNFDELTQLIKENDALRQELNNTEKLRDELFSLTIAEAEGKSPTQKAGKGSVYKEKKTQLDKLDKELVEKKALLLPTIKENNQRIAELKSKRDVQMTATVTHVQQADGFLARIIAISNISKQNRSVALISWFIILLFICIESAPIIVKLLSERGPYDELLEAEEYDKTYQIRMLALNKEAASGKKLAEAEKNKMKYDAEIQNNRDFINRLVIAQSEIQEKKVNKWKEREMDNIEKNFDQYIPAIERTLNGKEIPNLNENPINKEFKAN